MEPVGVDVSLLKFESADCERRFMSIRGLFQERTRGAGWDHRPLRKLGNFLQEDWCLPPEPGWNCFSGYARDKRRTEWLEVSTLFYDRSWPQVFGLNVSAGSNARSGPWGIYLHYADQGKGIVGAGLGVTFLRYEGEEKAQEIHLGSTYSYQAEATDLRVEAPGGKDAELALLYASPASLRQTGQARYRALLAEVEKAVAEHRVLKRVYGEYKGRGIPPTHEDVPLTPDEERAVLAKARAEIGQTLDSIEKNAETFHRLLAELIPERCWK